MTRPHVGQLVLALVLACADAGMSTTSSAAGSGSASTTPKASASSQPASSASSSAKPAAPKAQKPSAAMLKHLATGRELSKAEKYTEAMAEFDKALAITPNDSRVLSELGWAALKGKDLERSRKASETALKTCSDAKIRAQVLYNLGRVAEEEGKKDLAAKRYSESLALRDNKEVEKRLVAAGGAPPAACARGVADVPALCDCLKARPEFDYLAGSGKITCAASSEKLSESRLSLVTLKGDSAGWAELSLLVAKDSGGYRYLADLVQTFNPGVFGINNEGTFDGIESKKLETRTLVTVRHTQTYADSNMAGLELCVDTSKIHTLCLLSEKDPTTCPIAIPVEKTSSCGPGIELDPAETDPVVISMAKSAKDGAFKKSAKVSYTLSDAGELTVKLDEGDKDLLGKSILGTRKLF